MGYTNGIITKTTIFLIFIGIMGYTNGIIPLGLLDTQMGSIITTTIFLIFF